MEKAKAVWSEIADAFVPAIAITGAILLTLVAIGFLIYYIDHAARSMQASVIIDNVTLETRAVGARIFSREDAAAESAGDAPANGGIVEQVDERAAPAAIGQNTAGYVQSINEGRLFELAADEGLLLRVDAAIGDFVLPRQPLVSVWPADRVDDELRRTLRRAFALGLERTPHQDFEFGLVELVDIGVKALSPSINDPTTAMNTIDRIAELLVLLGRRGAPDCDRRDRRGRVCLIVRRPTFDRAVTLTFDQIRHHGAADPALMGKLIDSLGALAELVRAEHRPRLETAISTARAHAAREIDEPTDRERVDRAAAEALRRLRAAPAA